MKLSLSSIPLLPITIGLIGGIILGNEFAIIYAIAPFICGIISYILNKKILALTLFTASVGWIDSYVNISPEIPKHILNKESCYTATALSIKNNDNIRNIIAEIDIITDSASHSIIRTKCSIAIPSLNPHIEPGDEFIFIGTLTPIIDNRDLPHEFDIVKYYRQQGIKASAFITPENISNYGSNNSFLWQIKRIRSKVTQIISSLPISDDCIIFLNTTITGDTSMLNDDIRIKYSSSGLAHILALSGLHVGIITFVIAIFLFPLDIIHQRKLRFLISIILLWGYAIMTGLSPSVTRAVIMTSIFLIAYIIQRNHSPFNALCLAAILILIVSPLSIYSIGFQLSFVAVASILLFTRRLNPINERKRLLYNLFSLITVSISAMIGTGIIAALYFHNFPIYFIFANIISSIILPIIIAGGIIAIIASMCGIELIWMCNIIDNLYIILDWITSYITSLPGASLDSIYFNGWLLLPYFAIIACLYAAIRLKRVIWYIITMALIVFSITISYISRPKFPSIEYYIPRNTYYTNIVICDSSSLYLISTTHGGDSIDAIDKCYKKYEDYMGWRNIDSIIVVPQKFTSKNITRNGSLIRINTDIIAIVSDKTDLVSYKIKPKYALVCKGYNGEIEDISNTIKPDTILLSKDLHKKRISRYINSCKVNNIPYVSLRENGFHHITKQ